eukprot:CAMPEP_0195515146 /NCGR_PEP_ID=MMETSP0794_2-20130614/6321_1 /TAXON_ID=515487 /ORGANISM="Stephanopyxis turris, Strain CCMP 815" /LENGTH=536 /DNA_ID=CAMNT_0040643529 /DNA_START=134 /DNA_END=1744 /DNA_ORIENTATION=-
MISFWTIALLALTGMASGRDTYVSEAISEEEDLGDESPDKVSSRLEIHIPQSLFKAEGYKHREALFGVPPYGGSIAQMVYYADSDLCDSIINTRGGYPIRPKDSTGKMEPWPTPFILMVDRGGCTFVQKVRNAQRNGASGVIIADNLCLCRDGATCTSNDPMHTCQSGEPIMADDGSGSDVTIPSFLMFKQDADLVKQQVKANNPVQMEMAWSLPSPDDRVEYDLWTTPSDTISKRLQQSFKSAALALGSHAYFTPHMFIYDGVKSMCRSSTGDIMCHNLCTNHGRYCATDPDGDLEKGISGADVVKESLRRMCIWSHYGKEDGIGEKWWDYVNEFMLRCDEPEQFSSSSCVADVYAHTGIEASAISQCMSDTGGLDADKANSMLEDVITSAKDMGVVVLPTAFVNESAMRGKLTFTSVFSAICAGFLVNTEPEICTKCQHCPDQEGCVQLGDCGASGTITAYSKKGVSAGTFVGTILLICSVFGVGGFLHWKKTQKDMKDQVKGILAEYMPLESEDGEIGSAMDFAKRAGSTEIS